MGGAGTPRGRAPPRPRPSSGPWCTRRGVAAATAQATACRAQCLVTQLPDISGVSQLGNNPDGFRQDHGGEADTGSLAGRAW